MHIDACKVRERNYRLFHEGSLHALQQLLASALPITRKEKPGSLSGHVIRKLLIFQSKFTTSFAINLECSPSIIVTDKSLFPQFLHFSTIEDILISLINSKYKLGINILCDIYNQRLWQNFAKQDPCKDETHISSPRFYTKKPVNMLL